MPEDAPIPDAVRRAYRELAGALDARPLPGGLLHRSLVVRSGEDEFVLQRISDVFAPEIQDNIAAVTAHLEARGMVAPRLLRTATGETSFASAADGRWRLMTYLGGVSFERLDSTAQAASAGALVGRFHRALRDFEGPLAPMGIPYRDTAGYLAAMERALSERAGHRLHDRMRPLAEQVIGAFEALGPAAADLPRRVIHGDLKLANVLFESREPPGCERAFALVDLDTLMRAPLWMELGDVWRSWCNRSGEEGERPSFDLEAFEASLRGFLSGHVAALEPGEGASLATAVERITLEVCTRFVTDALEESYFGWDETRYPAAGEHNAARAEAQWRLYESARATRPARVALIDALG